jgi:hypothetical protein
MVDVALDEHRAGRGPDMTCESFLAGAFILQGTRMLTFLQERLVRPLAEAAKVRIVEPPIELPTIMTYMSWEPSATNDPAHRWLRQRITRLVVDLVNAATPINSAAAQRGDTSGRPTGRAAKTSPRASRRQPKAHAPG